MRRSWLVWAASIAIFFLTAGVIVVSGSAQKSAQGNQSFYPSFRGERFVHGEQLDSASNPELERLVNPPRSFTERFQSRDVNTSSNSAPKSAVENAVTGKSETGYQPQERVYLAHPSNYGERFAVDANGNAVNNQYIVVLHETVGSVSSALNLFQTNHPNDADQVSYHSLIGLDGTVYYIVPPEQRAFGAGNSVFRTSVGEESVYTNPDFPSSVNNFAYHISLETPPDGQNNNNATHSGYTEAQYQSLAWLLARTTVPNDRITTHKDVDRSGSRSDPRSFDSQRLVNLLSQYPSRAGL
ncbi:MAG: peptidoglycan recognition family protein [Cyanobacteria bacterium P01_F01_bin.3]